MSGLAKRLIPLLDRVVVQRIKAEAQTKAGIFLPESAKGPMNTAKVVAIGQGKQREDGSKIPPQVSIGDTVIVPEYGGYSIKLDEDEFHVYRDDDLIAVLKDN